MRADIVPGAVYPHYELPDHTSTPRRLCELQGDDPMILTLARGHYCPKEHQQHLELAVLYPKIAVAFTRILTIATWPFRRRRTFSVCRCLTHRGALPRSLRDIARNIGPESR